MSGRGRKKGAVGEQSRALLLSIAAEEFAANGYYGTKISTIVKKAELSQPTFYLYFQSKEAIFQELVDLFGDKLVHAIKQSRLESDIEVASVSEKIIGRLARIFTFFDNNQELTWIGFSISGKSNDIKKQMAMNIEENLVFEVQEGYIREEIDSSIVAESLVAVIERLTFTKLFQGLKEPEELALDVADFLMYGLIASSKLLVQYETVGSN